MATEAQTKANRANAQNSTGPRTPEGKETASQNSLKHGLFARETVIRGEDQVDFSQEAVLDRLLRYERRIESSLYRMLNQLRRVHDQVRKAFQEGTSILERWREEDWSAKKARLFANYAPPNASPGPTGPTTNTLGAEVSPPGDHPPLPYGGPAPEGPPEDEMRKTNPIPGGGGWDEASAASDAGQSCKTNPMCASPGERQVPCSAGVMINPDRHGPGETKPIEEEASSLR